MGDAMSLMRNSFVTVLVFGVLLVAVSSREPYVPGNGGMMPALERDQRVWIDKLAYGLSAYSLPLDLGLALPASDVPGFAWAQPARGDVIVYRHAGTGSVTRRVNRVVGLPGETVTMREGRLYINDILVSREPLRADRIVLNRGDERSEVLVFLETLPSGDSYEIYETSDDSLHDNFGPVSVPDGHVFVIGDNRDHTLDSRVIGEGGFVRVENVIGRVLG